MFGPESKLFPRQSKAKNGQSNSQYPGQLAGDIPDWKEKYQYLENEEVFYLGNYYRSTANHIASENFLADQGLGLWVDMITVPVPPAVSIGYTNVAFVDNVNGSNATGLVGRFDKPFLTIAGAKSAIAATFPSATARGLIHVRKGTYAGVVTMENFIDFYCDADVRFTGTWSLAGADINCNIFGYASWILTSTSRCFSILNSCNLYIEGHYLHSEGAWGEINTTNANFANVVMNFTRVTATTSGNGFGITIRSNVNLTMNVKEYVKANHSVFDIRTISGKIIINTPEIILGGVNIFGGNFKQCVIIYTSNAGSKVIINANLRNEQLVYLGGISAMITVNGAANGDVELNGNIYAGDNVGIYSNLGANTKLNYQGDIKSDLRAVVILGSGSTLIRDSHIQHSSISATTGLIFMNATQNAIFKNCILRNETVDGNIADKSTISGSLSFIDCIATSNGAGGFFVTSPVAANTIKAHNVRSNKDLHVDVTDVLVPTGFIFDANIVTLSL